MTLSFLRKIKQILIRVKYSRTNNLSEITEETIIKLKNIANN
jgi:hypothetical protein